MMDKENPRSSRGRPGYVAALVQRKQQEAAAQVVVAGDGKAPLPRVAVLGSQLRSSIVSGGSNRPLSSLRNVGAQPTQSVTPSVRPSSASTQRTGCKPATHSTRSLVPLLDARAAGRARSQAAASQAPAFSVPSSSAIGDPGLDVEEQQLQAELALYDQQLERLHEQKSQRRSATPDQRAVTPGVSSGPAAATQQPSAADQQQGQVQVQAEQQPRAAQPEPQPEAAEAAAIPAAELSIVRAVTTATGTGCKDIIAAHGATALPAGACWTTRGHRVLRLESSAILQLWGRSTADITLRITFADAASVPRVVRLEHAPTPTAPFALLGDIRLQSKSLTQLRHLFRLGKHLEVQRCLRITLMGHMAEEHSGAHRVSHMLLTSGLGPQRAQSSQSAGAAPAAALAAQPSVYHSVQSMPGGTLATADSADSGDRLSLELTRAAPALSEQQQQQLQQAPAGGGPEPRVPPLALAAMLADFGTSQQTSDEAFAAASLPTAPAEQPPQSEEVASSPEQLSIEPAEQSQSAAELESARAAAEQATAAPPLPQQSVSVSWHEDPAESEEGGCAALEEEAEAESAPAAGKHSAMEAPSHAAACSAQFASRAAAVEGAAALLSSACREVQQSELLRTLLRVALLAGNFLNAGNRDGAAAGFQIDALLKLKDVRSTRARSRTLLHFVAREVARQHPAGACLIAALPSAAAAAQLDLPAAKAELRELTAAVQDGAALERLRAAQAHIDQAEEAFKQLGGFINGQRSTMDAPRAFFGVLHAFAAELDAAHEENSAADAAAADKGGSGRKDGKQRRRSQSGSPASSAASGEQPRRRRDSAQETSRLAEGAQPEAAQNLLKQQAAERRRPSVTAEDVSSGSRPRHHSPQPCLSKTAVAAVGGSRRPAQPSSSAGQAGERQAAGGNQAAAGAVRSSCPPAAMAAALAGEAPSAPPVAAQAAAGSGDQQGDKLSTPIVSLLAESARLITSLDCGEAGFAGFGSALGSEAAGSSSAATSGTQGTASTPDGAVRPAEAPEADADYSTPRGAVSLRWQGQQGQARHAAGAGNRAEGQLPAAVPAAVGAGASERLSMNLLRQRSLQQLSPTSTPLSSLGRQSSRSSGGYSSSNGSTPPSSMRLGGGLGMMVRRSSSPLGLAAAPGLGAAVVAAESAAAAAARARDTMAAAPGSLFSPELTSTPSELPDAQRLSTPPDSAPTGATSQQQPAEQQPTAQWAAAAAALQQQQEHWESLPSPPVPGKPAAAVPADEAAHEEEEEEAAEPEQQQAAAAAPPGFGAMHSAASSFDLTFYAPFSMDRQGQSAFLPAQQARGGLSTSLPCGQDLAGVWGPLAAEQQRQRLRASGGGVPGHASVDDLALSRAGAAAGGRKRVSFSLPNSPRRGAADLSAPAPHASRQPPPLNLAGLAGRLQVQPPRGSAEGGANNSNQHGSAGGGVGGSSAAQYLPQLSPVLEALLGNVPTPLPHGVALAQPADGADLADDDLADMAGYSSDQEDEWQQLERIQQHDAEWQRQQAAERERREAFRLGQPLRQSLGNPYQQAQAGVPAEASAGGQQRALGQEQHQQGQHQQGQHQQRVYLERELAALQQQRQAEEAAQQGRHQQFQQQQQWEEGEEDEQERAALQQLPSPLNSATSDLDVAVARLLASAGNTPSGPLCQGVRQADAFADVQQREPAALRVSADGLSGGRRMALLEPVMPAPLGEGVRASRGMAQRVPAAALRMSLEGPRTTLRGAVSAPEAQLSQEAAAWQAEQAAAAAAGGYGEEEQSQQQARGAAAYSSMQGADWGGGYGPARRRPLRSLRRFLGRQY